MEATQMSIHRWMDKEIVVHIYNGILLSNEKEHIWDGSNEEDEPKAYGTEWSKSEREKKYHILMQVCGIQTDVTDKTFQRAAMET